MLNRLPPSIEFPLADFHKCIRHFAFIAGYTHHRLNPEDPANFEATQLMCDLHDALEAGADGTLSKPVDHRFLAAEVDRLLRERPLE